MNSRLALRFLLPLAVCVGVVGFLVSRPSPVPVSGKQFPRPAFPADDQKPEILFRLSDGMPPRPAPPAPAAAERLPESETKALLEGVPRTEAEIAAAKEAPDFAFPPASSPPPRTGATVTAAFPPPAVAPRPAVAPDPKLTVTRYGPTGETPNPKQIAVTFSQPMVPVTDLDTLKAMPPPVELVPAVPGHWRWLGTRTAAFEPTGGAFPKATDFKLRVAAGTRSAVGGTLATEATWRFSTPPAKFEETSPEGDDVSNEPLVFVRFDQKMDANVVAKALRATAGGAAVTLRPATAEEIAADEDIAERMTRKPQGCVFAFRFTAPLAKGVPVRVTLPAGTPSAEGPRGTPAAQTFQFKTAGALRVVKTEGSGQSPDAWTISFSNQLDPLTFTESLVTVEPSPVGLTVGPSGSYLYFRSRAKARTTYTVKLSPDLRDIHGQKLGPTAPVVIRTGDFGQMFSAPNGGLTIPDPLTSTRIQVESLNYTRFRLTVRAVSATDRIKFEERSGVDVLKAIMPGRIVATTDVPIAKTPNEPVVTPVDLAPYLPGGHGNLVVSCEPLDFKPSYRGEKAPVFMTWVAATDLGLDVVTDANTMIVRATSLKTGAPLAGVSVAPGIYGAPVVTTDATGRVAFSLEKVPMGQRQRLTATLGDDAVCVFATDFRAQWPSGNIVNRPVWYVFDDRALYRPDEDVHIKGWIRNIRGGPSGDVSKPDLSDKSVIYEVFDGRNNSIGKGSAVLDDAYGFDLAFHLPKTANIGGGRVQFYLSNDSFPSRAYNTSHSFRIEEFRRPEFEVQLAPEAGPFFLNEPTTVTARAAYLAGGGLADSEAKWNVSAQASDFRPPNWEGFTFGEERRWWWLEDETDSFERFSEFAPNRYYRGRAPDFKPKNFTGRTDGDGKHTLKLDFDRFAPVRPAVFTLSATVQDVNRQTFSATRTLLVHPSASYVGLRRKNEFVPSGEAAGVEVIVADVAGKPVAGAPVRLRFARLVEKFVGGRMKEIETDPMETELVSTGAPLTASFPAKGDGIYRVTAVTADEKGRPAVSRLRVWVGGGDAQKLTLVPDRREYRPGETANLTVSAPFENGTGLVTICRDGIISSEIITMKGKLDTIKIPIREEWTPNVTVSLTLNPPPRGPDGKGASAPETASVNLKIPPRSRTLTVAATPREKVVGPGGETTVDVTVTDADGRPVTDGRVTLVVVDESVLALTGYKLADPVALFHPKRMLNVMIGRLRDQVAYGGQKTGEPFRLTLVGQLYKKDAVTRSGASAMSMEDGV